MEPFDLPKNRCRTRWYISEGHASSFSRSTKHRDLGLRMILQGLLQRHHLLNVHIFNDLKASYPFATTFLHSRHFKSDSNPKAAKAIHQNRSVEEEGVVTLVLGSSRRSSRPDNNTLPKNVAGSKVGNAMTTAHRRHLHPSGLGLRSKLR